jgi:hypothetical protein
MNFKSMHRYIVAVLATAAALVLADAAHAQQYIYANAAGTNNLHKIDAATGATVKMCPMGKGNGRGIVVVGNVVYYTIATSGNIFKTNFTTCSDDGIAFTVPGVNGIATIAYDGTNFWVGDYTGPNKAFLVSPTGTLLRTITLNSCTTFCDGLEFYNGKLISNDADGGSNYSIYTTSGGAPTTSNFITTGTFTTGIAFDGTDFYVSLPTASPRAFRKYSGTTGALISTINLVTTDQFEDLSADYAIVLGPSAASPVPTLGEWAMVLLAGLLALSAFFLLRRRAR